ncbi:hypothetical protein BSKO_08135 [Bryopsis sp. KO-2023]|nr:hypothetical protein BSKO_08135 [Bryopsis sp. KO-2023]
MAAVDAVSPVDMLSDRKPRTPEEKALMQSAKIKALRERLLSGGHNVVEKLVQGGEFRPEEEPLNDNYLRRWLRARNWKLNVAEEVLISHADWRVAYCPEGRVKESDISNELATEKLFLQGADRQGRGFAVVMGAKHNAWWRDAAEVERAICYCLDAQVDVADATLNPDRQTSVLFDLTDLGVSNIDLTVMNQLYEMLSAHFVERLGILFIYNAPTIFWATWKTFSPIIPEVTLEKIKFIYPDDLSELEKHIQPEILPKLYKGTGDLVPVEKYVESYRQRSS